MITQFKNILVLAPHTDDGELGAGGTINKLIENGVNVYYVAFSTAEESVPAGLPRDILKTEVKNATKKLGIPNENLFIFNYQVRKLNYIRQEILEELIRIRIQIDPELV
jgi:LmbE family N-acetylglucosaminyl deacetylase